MCENDLLSFQDSVFSPPMPRIKISASLPTKCAAVFIFLSMILAVFCGSVGQVFGKV